MVVDEASEAQDQDPAYEEEGAIPEDEAEFEHRMQGNLEEEQPEEAFVPGVEEQSTWSDTVPSTLNLHETIHWQDAFLLSWRHKWMWDEVVRRDVFKDCGGLDTIVDHVIHVLKSVHMPLRVIRSITEIDATVAMSAPGKWYRINLIDHALASIMADELLDEESIPELKEAYHGTSIDNLPLIVARGPDTGPHSIVNKPRVHCEGSHRKACTLGYMTHVHIQGLNPMWMWAAQLECLVDRSRGGTKHRQWTQEHGSVHVVGINLHVFNLKDGYKKGFVGWFKVH